MNRSILSIFLLIILTSIVLRFLLAYPTSPDSYLHYTIGRYIVDNHHIPTHNQLSFKSVEPSLELIPHSWLTDVIFYIFQGISPYAPIFGLLVPTAFLALFLIYRTLHALHVPQELAISSLSLYGLLLTIYWRVHPLIFATLLCTLLVLFYIRAVLGERKYWYFIPLVIVLYANSAGGFIIIPLLFLLSVFLFNLLITSLSFAIKDLKIYTTKRYLSDSFFTCILGCIGALLNPSGYKIILYGPLLYALLARKWFSTLGGILTATNSNVIRNTPSTLPYAMFLSLSLVVCVGLAVLLIRNPKKFIREFLPYIPVLTLLSFGFFWIRFIPISGIAIGIFIGLILMNFSGKWAPLIRTLFLTICTSYALVYLLLFPKLLSIPFPTHLTNYIKKNTFKLNILSTYEYTGYASYFAYPAKASIDAQDDLFDENETIVPYSDIDPVSGDFFDNIASTYSINTVFTSKGADYLTSTLSNHPDWSLYYLDVQGFVFAKKDSVPPSFDKENSLSSLNLQRNLGYDPENATSAAQQLERFVRKNPESALARGQLASIYRLGKRFSQAEAILRTVPEDQWDLTMMTEMGRLKAAQGLCVESETYLLQAVNQRKEQNISKAILDLAVLYAGCFGDKEKAAHYFKRYNSFVIPSNERDFVKKLMHDFDITLEN